MIIDDFQKEMESSFHSLVGNFIGEEKISFFKSEIVDNTLHRWIYFSDDDDWLKIEITINK